MWLMVYLFVPNKSHITVYLEQLHTDIFHSAESLVPQSQCTCVVQAVSISRAACGVYLSVAEMAVIRGQTAYTPHCGMEGT